MVTSQITLALAHFYQQKLLMNFHGDAVSHMYTLSSRCVPHAG